MPKEENLTPNEISEAVEFHSRKLGFFLVALNISEEKREAWLRLLPEMSLKQLERLTKILEEQYLQEKTRDIDKAFEDSLNAVKEAYGNKMTEENKETIQKIEEISKQISPVRNSRKIF